MGLRIDGVRFPIVLIFALYSSLPIQLDLSFSRYARWDRQGYQPQKEHPYLFIRLVHCLVICRRREAYLELRILHSPLDSSPSPASLHPQILHMPRSEHQH
jgi:hypothetical protein